MGIIDNIINGVTAKSDRARERSFRSAAGDGARMVTEAITGNRAAGRTAEAVVEGRASDRTILRGGHNIYNEEQRKAKRAAHDEERARAHEEKREARRTPQEPQQTTDRPAVAPAADVPVVPATVVPVTPATVTPAVAKTAATVTAATVVAEAAEAEPAAEESVPATTIANPQAAEYFWNAYSNIQSKVGPEGGYDFNREQLTYIQADERYVSYTEQYADLQGLTGTARSELLDTARETHAASLDTLENSPGYSTDMQGLANDFYFVIEQSYPDSPAATATATPPAVETPAVAAETPAVTTAMGDVAMPASVEVSTTVASVEPAAKPYDAAFTADQLGELGQKPEGGITATPVTAPIAIEDMPIPFSHEEKLEMGREKEDTSTVAEYTVERGDNLWKIAQSYYGLDDPKHIKQAVETIAAANNMTEGVQANRLNVGQVIKLPDSPTAPAEGQAGLNWAALDADTNSRLRSTFNAPATGIAHEQSTPQERSASLPAQGLGGGLQFT